MSLELPTKFEQDIQGKDTNLVPVVKLGTETSGNIFLSTGLYDILGSDGNLRNHLPLLLNIPSLKESIDIEKRNYRISSINIDISAFKPL